LFALCVLILKWYS